jgi:excinuclease ABC subunit B
MITPASIKKNIDGLAGSLWEADYATVPKERPKVPQGEIPFEEIPKILKALKKEMHQAAKNLEFEKAAELRDRIKALDSTSLALG